MIILVYLAWSYTTKVMDLVLERLESNPTYNYYRETYLIRLKLNLPIRKMNKMLSTLPPLELF